MNKLDEIVKLIILMRQNAANELKISNEILSLVDAMVNEINNHQYKSEPLLEAADKLVDIAVKLTDQSTVTSHAISKVMGIIE